MVAPVSPRPTHPYVHQHSPGAGGRVYDPDPVFANGCGNMMYRGYEQLAHLRRISGDAKYDQPFDLVYDDDIRYRYSAEEIAAGLCEQFKAPMDANGASLRSGIDCEVGKVFPICVTVGGLDMLLYDRLHGTDYASGYQEWLDFAKGAFIAGDPDEDGYFRWHSTFYDRDIHYAMNRPENQIPLFWARSSSPFSITLTPRSSTKVAFVTTAARSGRQLADRPPQGHRRPRRHP
jgi:hypothetical protein